MNLTKKNNAIIISHFMFKDTDNGAGIPHNIRNYLLSKINHINYIDHPFPGANYMYSESRIYTKNKLKRKEKFTKTNYPTPILFLIQYFITIYYIVKSGETYDLCFACDNLSVVACYPLKKFGVIKKLIYYSIDYSPKRYSNKFLNFTYHLIDRIACLLSDINWVTTKNITKEKLKNPESKFYSPFHVVLNGFNKKEIKVTQIGKINKFNLVFLGVLYKKQGVQLAIKNLPSLIKKFPKIHLTIIGSGEHENFLKEMTNKLRIKKYITFTGYMDNHLDVINVLNQSSIGLAPYVPDKDNFSIYGAPSKIRLYLLCGLPVITTDVPMIAKTIKKKNAGLVIKYNDRDFKNSIITLLTDKRLYEKQRKNALLLSNKYDIDKILDKAILNL